MIRGKRGDTTHWLCECEKDPSCRVFDSENYWTTRQHRSCKAIVNGTEHEIFWFHCRGYRRSDDGRYDLETFSDMIFRATGFEVIAKGEFYGPPWQFGGEHHDRVQSVPVVVDLGFDRQLSLKRDLWRACLPRPYCSQCKRKIHAEHFVADFRDYRGERIRDSITKNCVFCNVECELKWRQNWREIQRERMAIASLKRKVEAAAQKKEKDRIQELQRLERWQRTQQRRRMKRLRQLVSSVRRNLHDRNALASLNEEFELLQNLPG